MRYSSVYIDAFGYELPPHVVTSEDLEHRLEIPIQVDRRPGDTLELEELVALVPPPVRDPLRKSDALARARVDPTTVQKRGNHPFAHGALLVLPEVDVQRRAFTMCRQRPMEVKLLPAAGTNPADGKAFSGVAVLQQQRCAQDAGLPIGDCHCTPRYDT